MYLLQNFLDIDTFYASILTSIPYTSWLLMGGKPVSRIGDEEGSLDALPSELSNFQASVKSARSIRFCWDLLAVGEVCRSL